PWWRPMERALRAELLPALLSLPVLPAKLGNAAAVVGAARLVLATPS
ncbi:MAG TPA: sugar kinase, partial [Arthrobacter bacterium]|nr:sugar kinase [Arthrobacter sp.]